MAKTLREYLANLPNAKQLDDADLEAYRKKMVNEVIPKNLRAAALNKQQTNESRIRAAQSSPKRDQDET